MRGEEDQERSHEAGGEVRRIHILYFLSRNGHIEHPHLIRVRHLHRTGVRLRDVKRWLSELRGNDMPDYFAWSYKRRYKTGFVWQDLTDDDLITPISDNEFVLKGSLLPSLSKTMVPAKKQEEEKVAVPSPETMQMDGGFSTESASPADEKSPEVPKSKSSEVGGRKAAFFDMGSWRKERNRGEENSSYNIASVMKKIGSKVYRSSKPGSPLQVTKSSVKETDSRKSFELGGEEAESAKPNSAARQFYWEMQSHVKTWRSRCRINRKNSKSVASPRRSTLLF